MFQDKLRRAVRMSRKCKNSQIIIGHQDPPQFILQDQHLASLIFVFQLVLISNIIESILTNIYQELYIAEV